MFIVQYSSQDGKKWHTYFESESKEKALATLTTIRLNLPSSKWRLVSMEVLDD